MNGFTAIGHMLLEEGRIVSARYRDRGIQVDYNKILDGQIFMTQTGDLEAEGWELGWSCPKCMGDGVISVRCRCIDRPCHIQAEYPCCDGQDEAECPDCERGIQWRDLY